MINELLKRILSSYDVDNDFRNEIKDGFRIPLQNTINKAFDVKPNYRYGGSLAKGTANKGSCDIDLLCYMDSSVDMSVESIYERVISSLDKSEYISKAKNSAICVTGDSNDPNWDITVDVVPGKYTSNEANKDVFLWCNRDKRKLKSNPEIQINKIQKSSSKDVIRLIKIYRENHSFKFKSFFLEIFAVDVAELLYKEEDSLYDKMIKFCSLYNKIGITKIYDPANPNNDIMKIHSDEEFALIRKKIKELYEVLLTNNEESIKDCFYGRKYDINSAYAKEAKSHSSLLKLNVDGTIITLSCKEEHGDYIYSNQIIPKNIDIVFCVCVPPSLNVKSVTMVISNSGYESLECLRGGEETTILSNGRYYRSETTSYNGNHYVQAIVRTKNGGIYYSKPFVVKIRDFK